MKKQKKSCKKDKFLNLIEAGSVAAAIKTVTGNIYVGVCFDTSCSLGMCAERNAIANMITHKDNKIEKVLVITTNGRVLFPCGSCRELMMQLDESAAQIEILMRLS